MIALWIAVFVLSFALAITMRRLYVLETLLEYESAFSGRVAQLQARMLSNCPGYPYDEQSRAELLDAAERLGEIVKRHEARLP